MLSQILKSPLQEIFKFLNEKELCKMQATSSYFKKHAGSDYLWRYLLDSQSITYHKGFK